jgi:radical SAM superfamily enzyme YgiQ (UPF0313 family)
VKIYFINPPFKAEYGRFSRESRSPAITKSGALYYPLWLMYAAAYAKKNGHTVLFLDAPAKQLDTEQSLAMIRKNLEGSEEKVLFVIGTSTPSIKNDVNFGAGLKDVYPYSFVLLAGTHPSALPEETLMINPQIDAVARGEYDLTVNKLAKVLETEGDLTAARGITYRDRETGTLRCNESMPYLDDLDELPYAAEIIKEYLDEKDYFIAAATYPMIQIFSGRGCPFQCNFCLYPQTMFGHKYRMRSSENIAGEFQYIADNFPDVREVVFEDDNFTTDKERVLKICSLLIERKLHKRLKWFCNARVNLDLETMKAMKKAGCRLILCGVESGNQQILRNIKKGITIKQVEDYVKNAKKAGLLVHSCYIFGNEGETRETMQETLDLALKLNTDTAQFYPLIPYPGTEAYARAKQHGQVESNYEKYCKEDGTHNTVLHLPGLSAEEMVMFSDHARRKYYLRPGYILHRIRLGLAGWDDFRRSLKAFNTLRYYLFRKK